MQLEHNGHEPLGIMPTLHIEHSSEHSQAFQDLTNSDSPVPGNIWCTRYTGSDQAQSIIRGASFLGHAFADRSPCSGSNPTRSHPGDLVGKYRVQASATDLEALPFSPNPPPPHWAILPWGTLCSIAPFGLGQNARWTDLPLANTSRSGQLQKVS